MHILQAVKNKEPKAGKRDSAVAAHEAVMADLHEACGQDMLEKAPDELEDIESDMARPVAAFLAIGEGDGSIFDSHDSGIGDSHPEDIGGEVFQGCLAVAYGLTVDVPGDLPDAGIDFVEQPLSCHLGLEFGPEDFGEGSDRQIEVVAGRQPLFSVGGQSTSRDDEVQMGMILHLSSPGMEHGGKSRQIGADEARIFGQFFDRAGRCREHGAIGGLLMGAAEGPKLFGHGEGEQEVIAGQSPLKLCIEPLAAFVILALRAVAVAAGAVDQVFFTAAVALIDGNAVCSGTAVDDGIDGLFMLQRHIGISGEIFGAEGAEDLGNGAHDHTSSMTELMIW